MKSNSNYKITFYENNKLMCNIFVACNDSLVAENIAEKMAGKNITYKVDRA